jgi:hypothetical protein
MLVPDLAHQRDLLVAFNILRKIGVLWPTKPSNELFMRDAFGYSGSEADDEWFFFTGSFNATITDEGTFIGTAPE